MTRIDHILSCKRLKMALFNDVELWLEFRDVENLIDNLDVHFIFIDSIVMIDDCNRFH
jgi:hypothetical protein